MMPRKRVWTVADVAEHVFSDRSFAACRRAKRILSRLDARHGGQIVTRGRTWTVRVATLRRLEPGLFVPLEALEWRVDAVEEEIDETRIASAKVAAQCAQNVRDLAWMRRAR